MGHEKVHCSPLFAVLLFPISRNKGTDDNWRCRSLLHRAPPPTGKLAGPHCFMQKQPCRGDVVLWKGRPDKKPSKPPATCDTGVSEGEGLQAVALQRGVLVLLGFRLQPPVPVLALREGKDYVSFLCSSLILVEYWHIHLGGWECRRTS